MSKAARLSILILAVMLIATFVYVGVLTIQNQSAGRAKGALVRQLEEIQLKETKYQHENKALQEKLKVSEAAKVELEDRLTKVNANVGDLESKISKVTAEREALQKRQEELQKQKDDLAAKLKENAEPQVVYKYIEKPADNKAAPATEGAAGSLSIKTAASSTEAAPPDGAKSSQAKSDTPVTNPAAGIPQGEEYWAQVLKTKAALDLELEDVKNTLTQKNIEMVELKKANSDLQLELGNLKSEKETIERQIKKGQDLADNLSLTLARAENEKKFLTDRIGRLTGENSDLRDQIKQLSSTKIALEKSIVRLQDEKKDVEKKLLESENVIQTRIDEIWKIKQNLTENFKAAAATSSNSVELSPIVVSPQVSPTTAVPEIPGASESGRAVPAGFYGSVVSVNEENNFVIVDVGTEKGLKLGDNISVYRGADYIAGLEVIQVRKDIAAADIKNKVTAIQVGDVVR